MSTGSDVPRPGERSTETTSMIPALGAEAFEGEAPDAALPEAQVIAALPAGSALLVVRQGPNSGSRFLLDRVVTTVGRHPDADIFLDDVTVSRKHAEFVSGATGFVVRDVGSLNGTYVNRQRVDEAALRDGDVVQVGKFRLSFVLSPNAGRAAG